MIFGYKIDIKKTRNSCPIPDLIDKKEYDDMSTLFWTLFYRTTYLNFLEFICKSKIIYLIPSRVNKLAIARP